MKNLLTNLSRTFDISVPASEEIRRQRLLNTLLWTVEVLTVVFLFIIVGFVIFVPDKTKIAFNTDELNEVLFALSLVAICTLILIFINRKVSSLLASIIFVILFFVAGLFDTPLQITDGRSLLNFAIPIVMSGLLIRPWASFIIASISCLTITFIAIFIDRVPNAFAMAGFFMLAIIIWMATLNLERYVKKLGEVNIELQKSEEHYRKLVEIMPDMVVLDDLEGNVLMINQAGVDLLGYSEATEIVGQKNSNFIAPDNYSIPESPIRKILELGKVAGIEVRAIKKEGSPIFMEISGTLLKDINGVPTSILTVGRDISLRKQVEENLLDAKNRLQVQVSDKDVELQRANERLNELVLHSPAIIYSSSPFGGYETTFISRNVSSMMGYSTNDFTSEPNFWLDHIHPEDRPSVMKKSEGLFLQGKVVTEYRFLTADGSYRWVRDEERLIRDDNGTPRDIVGSWVDITKEKEANLALQESEERYRTLSEAGRDIIFIVNREGRFEYVNQNLALAFDRSVNELVGRQDSQLFPVQIAERHKKYQEKVFNTGEALLVEEINEFPGGERWMSIWLVPMKNQVGEVVSIMGVARDISKLKSIEAALTDANNTLEKRVVERTADLMASHEKLRQLTRVIVHAQEDERRRISRELHDEAGQSLVGLKMSMDQMLSEIPENLTDIRKKISKAIDGLSVLMRDIRALAHGLRPTALDVAGLNVSLSGLCQEFSERSHLLINYEGMELPVLPDEISITLYRFAQEALTNIIKHARAATAQVVLLQHPASIELTVLDDGHGFDAKTIRNAISIQGMEERLGLLGGKLDIHSAPGRGASIRASIPFQATPPDFQ
jgi:PAS domain S-box-containing protein